MPKRQAKPIPARLKSPRPRFVLCIRNDGYPASLEERKIYRLIPDRDAKAHDLVRVVDESGEDYLYPAAWFVSITVPQAAITELSLAS
ncbi:MAG: hypothetical protein HZB53_21870 [Chloroflexi bacterium]|nr:hypothetical protein [Chloroflexota bacterium]